jgi:predicted nucleic acid-binding protein
MKDRIFIDTNILVYTQNQLEKSKQDICRELLVNLIENNTLYISTQVIQEYYNVATQKLKLDKLTVKQTIKLFSFYEIIVNTPQMILSAIDIHILNQLSFWDSLIISAAKSANCSTIITEDMNNGQIIEGIEILNPLTL